MYWFYTPRGEGGEVGLLPGDSSSGCAARLSHFPHLFSDQTSKIHTRLSPLFLDQTEAPRAEKNFMETAPRLTLSQGLDLAMVYLEDTTRGY